MVIASNMLLDVGIARDNQLLCSSFGSSPLNIGAPSYTSTTGNIIRVDVAHPFLPEGKTLVVSDALTGVTVEIHEDTVLEMAPRDADLATSLFGWSKRRVMMHRGKIDINRLQANDNDFAGTHSDGHSLVAWKRSRIRDFAAAAVVNTSEITRGWIQVAKIMLPFGILLSISLLYVIQQFARKQTSLQSRIKRGLARDQFFLVYQPIVDLTTGYTVGAEALVRWRQDDGELISPDLFIPVAEEQHLISQITERVISIFERESRQLLNSLPDFFIAINISADDMISEQLPSRLCLSINRMTINAKQIHIEATERVLINHETIKRSLTALREAGIPTSIDDFGTGYSSLAYLTDLPIDYLKIDKAFIDTIETNSVTSYVVEHIIELAKALDLTMIAEGVEEEHQVNYLREHGVQYAQGWLFSKPVTIDELVERLGKLR